jgi:hypothetical protein
VAEGEKIETPEQKVEAFIERINSAETPEQLIAIIAEQQRLDREPYERAAAEGRQAFRSPHYSPEVGEALAKAASPEDLVAQARESGILVDVFGSGAVAGQGQPEVDSEELAKRIAQARTPAELTEIMAEVGLAEGYR